MRTSSRFLLALVVVAACGGDATSPTTSVSTGGTVTGGTGGTGGTGSTGTGTPGMSATITVADDNFSPTPVTILKGGSVTWNFSTNTGHTVTFDDGTGSGVQTGGSYSKTFAAAGTYNYQCSIHYGMYGQVVVQ
jgi:plastocyanin